VKVILRLANQERGRFTSAKDGCNVLVEFRLDLFSDQWLPILCAEDKTDEDGRQRLRHTVVPSALSGLAYLGTLFPGATPPTADCPWLLHSAPSELIKMGALDQ